MSETTQCESKKKSVEKTQKTPTSWQTEAQKTPTSWQPERLALPAVPTANRPRTATSEDNRTKVPKVTNSIRRAVSGAVQVKATPAIVTSDVTSDSASSPRITTSAMRRRAAQSPHPNSLVPAPTSSEVLSVASGTSNGRRSVMHQGSMPLAFVLNTVKRLLEQHTMKHQPFLREDEFIRVSREYYPRRGFYLSC